MQTSARWRLATTLAVAGMCLCTIVPRTAHAERLRTVHVFVALADNLHQGIVPVPPRLGNGLNPSQNLYWGAAAGVKTFFSRSPDWSLVECRATGQWWILERCVFMHRRHPIFLVADAYRGDQIKQAIVDLFDAASGGHPETLQIPSLPGTLSIRGGANLVVYVGHDGLMDFHVDVPKQKNNEVRDVIILACASKQYFGPALKNTAARPLLWTTGLMAPEAYTLKAALDGWATGETGEQIRERAAVAYDKYQHCGLRGARRLFATGW